MSVNQSIITHKNQTQNAPMSVLAAFQFRRTLRPFNAMVKT
jgi:hypothetical protein